MKPPPFTVIPFSLAKIKSAVFPAISTVPAILEALLPVTSVRIAFASVFKPVFLVTIPPVFVTTASCVPLLLKITLFPLPTLKSINLLWDIPFWLSFISTTSVLFILCVICGPSVAGFSILAPIFLALKSLAEASSSTKPNPPVIKKVTIKLRVILLLFLRWCFSNLSLNFK